MPASRLSTATRSRELSMKPKPTSAGRRRERPGPPAVRDAAWLPRPPQHVLHARLPLDRHDGTAPAAAAAALARPSAYLRCALARRQPEPRARQESLGHENIATTVDLYGKRVPSGDAALADAVGESIFVAEKTMNTPPLRQVR